MKRPRARLTTLALLAALAAGIGGCGPEYDRTDIENVRTPTAQEGRLDHSRLEIPVGMIVTAHVVSYNDDNKVMSMSFRTKDPGIVEVASVITDHDFAFLGLEPGATEVQLFANDKLVLIIEAVVTEQSPPP